MKRFPFARRNRDVMRLEALDSVETNVMVTDDKYNIIYMNKSITSFLTDAETDLRAEFPHFRADGLIGSNIDVFHKNPSHQRRMLDRLTKRFTATIVVGKRSFDLIATPIFTSGKRTGSVVEWADATHRISNMDYRGQLAAIGISHIVVEFGMDGTILTANEKFLKTMGYRLDEVVGKNHACLRDQDDGSDTYALWQRLKEKHYEAGEYKFVSKTGVEIWLQCSYNTILDQKNKPYKIVQFATDVTAQKQQNVDYACQIEAISKSQAVIAFALDGTILSVNDNFLNIVGYERNEVLGHNHRMFMAPLDQENDSYRRFWKSLVSGEHESGEYLRIGKDGREIWIQASYAPILDLNGKPCRIVKHAVDVTRQVIARKRSEHINSALHDVATGAHELNASVKQIADAMGKSKDKADSAFGKTEEADKTTGRLSEVAQSMGGIVAIIGGITGQINLLALNATIEAARAGGAGRGFAVVASEVKGLANEARKATDQITQEIGQMRTVSDDVVNSLAAIKAALEQVRLYVASTADSVAEQSAVANEMSYRMHQVAAEAEKLGS